MQKQTIATCFGPASFSDSEQWSAHMPLPGFPELRRFVLLDIERYRPFLWLHSVEDSGPCLALASPRSFGLAYPAVPGESLVGGPAPAATLLVVTTFSRGEGGKLSPTPHAVAPICFDPDSMRFAQWILSSENAYRRDIASVTDDTAVMLPVVAIQSAA